MLIAVKKDIKSVKLNIKINCELVFVKIISNNTVQVIIVSFYRPPSSNSDKVELDQSLLSLTCLHNCNFLLCRDFNLPDIDWTKNCLKNNNPTRPGEGSS